MSTSLDDLENGSQQPKQGSQLQGDERRVNSILSEMNAAATVQTQPQYSQQPSYSPQVITVPPITTSTGSLRMDPDTARAHVIGSSTPSAADFQSMFPQRPINGPVPMYASQVAWTQSQQQPKESKPWKEAFIQFMLGPIAVAIIVFLLNMPVLTAIFSRNAQWMYLISGDISVSGLLVKSLLASMMFAMYQGLSAALV